MSLILAYALWITQPVGIATSDSSATEIVYKTEVSAYFENAKDCEFVRNELYKQWGFNDVTKKAKCIGAKYVVVK